MGLVQLVKTNMDYYRPLPNSLTIKQSEINGLGLFAVSDIIKGTNLGITHVEDYEFQDSYIRTPLGGFFNHSETPNIKLDYQGDHHKVMVTLRDIKSGEEITGKYTTYDPTK
jgi:SET domain-containing protein